MRFQWDDEKAQANLEKHGVSFGEATEVFYNPNAVQADDDEHSSTEDRFVIIGYSTRQLLFIVFVERLEDVIRIISARKPTPKERDLYEEGTR